jgi:hypothetical protein
VSDGNTNVRVLSLEDFQGTLQHRLDDVDAMLTKLDELGARRVPLGTFQDASYTADSYDWKLTRYAERVERLREAIVAAQTATAEIITAYRTTEARNQADAADIAARLGGVTSALTAPDLIDPRTGASYV